jgi:hypothetical protein
MFGRWDDGGLHVGILYQDSGGGAYTLHLCGHYDLKHEVPRDGLVCIICSIDPVFIPATTAQFRRLWEKYEQRGIPYGFTAISRCSFGNDFSLPAITSGQGLCCHTFVQAAYEVAGQPLLVPNDPPPRLDDLRYQQSVYARFEEKLNSATSGRTRRHFVHMLRLLGESIYRPFEVCGAASSEILPCDPATAERLGNEIEQRFFANSPQDQVQPDTGAHV